MRTLLFLFFVVLSDDTHSSDLIVSATRYESDRERTTSAVKKIDVTKFKAKKTSTLGEVLESVPHVYLNESGPGGTQTIHLRGSETSHVLVVLDGLPMNDPINTSKLYDFSKITLVGVKSVEILFGSHGVLYGSEAIGGVIYIKSLDPQNTMMTISTARGSNSTSNHKALIGGKVGKLNGFFGVERFDTEGFNATTSTSKANPEKDGSELLNIASKVGYETEEFKASLTSRIHLHETDLDKGFGNERDDENFTSDDRLHYHLLSLKLKKATRLLDPEMKVGYSDQKRTNLDLPDTLSTSTDTQLYRAKSTDVILSNNSLLTGEQSLIAGVHYKNEKGLFDLNLSGFPTVFDKKSEDTYALFFHHHFELTEKTILNSGFRAENSHLFGTNSSFKLGSSTMIQDNHRLYSLFSTGYKNPTLYQLHSQYGNKDLDPEKALSLEIGSEIKIDKLDINSNINFTTIDDFIDLLGTYPNQKYQNSSELSIFTMGINTRYQLTPSVVFDYSLDYTRAKNKSSGQELLNRPKWASKFETEFSHQDHSLSLDLEAKGKRTGGSTSSPVPLSGYALVHLGYSYEWKSLEGSLRLNNILDKKHINTSGFNTDGRSYLITISGRY